MCVFTSYLGNATTYRILLQYNNVNGCMVVKPYTIAHKINKEIAFIFTWLTQNKLLINILTSKITVFHMPHRHVAYQKCYNA